MKNERIFSLCLFHFVSGSYEKSVKDKMVIFKLLV